MLHRLSIASALAGILLHACASAHPPGERIRVDVQYLADDAREGRGVGSAGLDSAAAYIARGFRRAGLHATGADGYLQAFTIDPTAPAAAHAGIGEVPVANVIGLRSGRGALAGQAVVVGAHYDHLGRGGFGSLEPDSVGVIHNGADDNASGTAVMLEVARSLRDRDADHVRSIVFVAFTAEELGLIGSAHYVSRPLVANDSTYAMLNLDMVGRLGTGALAAFGSETAVEMDSLLQDVNRNHGLRLEPSGDGWGRSDQQSFYAEGIPVLHFFTGTHEDYHRPSDDTGEIDVGGAAMIAEFVADMAWTLATRTEPLTFVETPPPPPPVAGGYGAYLGSIPDMTASPDGVRLTGVRKGSPADVAGIQAGDVIVKLGTFEVTDLYQMTDALRSYRPGDTIAVHVRRGAEVLTLTATLGRRGG